MRRCKVCGKRREDSEFTDTCRANKYVCSVCKGLKRKTARTKHLARARQYKWSYGITEVDVQDLMNKQKGCCSICGSDFGVATTQYHIDHDHKTGEVRGLLCINCNIRLGWYERIKEEIRIFDNYLK